MGIDNIDKRVKDVADVSVYHDVRNASRSGLFHIHGFREVIVPKGQKEDPVRDLEQQAYQTKRIVRNVMIAVLAAAFVAFIIWWVVTNFENVQFNPPSDKMNFW